MKKFLVHTGILLVVILTSSYSFLAHAQTLSLNDGSVTQSKTKHIGINIGSINYWDNGQVLKNLVGSLNPGFEPLTSKQIWPLTTAGTATSFANDTVYDPVPLNYWAGASFTIVNSQTNNGQEACTGTIASNTGEVSIVSVTRNNGVITIVTSGASGYTVGNPIGLAGVTDGSYDGYPVGNILSVSGTTITVAQAGANSTSTGGTVEQFAPITYTTTSACGGPFSVGDIINISLTIAPTPESWWENSQGGVWAGDINGGKLTTDTTDLCATCGSQALTLNASASGSTSGAHWYFDGDQVGTPNNYVLMNGTYQISFWAKAASGSPTMTIGANRPVTGGFSCGTYTQVPTSTWTQYTYTCTAAEVPASLAIGTVNLAILATGGNVYLDNVSFEKTGSTQPSAFRDEVINTIRSFSPGTFRYWVNQNGESLDNWTRPDYARGVSGAGIGYQVEPSGSNAIALSLEDYLVICQTLGTEPYLEVPVTFSTSDAAGLIEFLAGPASTTYGARRIALGQTEPWTSVFSKIHLSFCNECWNFVFGGQNLPARATAPDDPKCPWVCYNVNYDYGIRASAIFAAMHAAPDYTAAPFDLVMNLQTGNSSLADDIIQEVQPDSVELEGYTYIAVSSFATDAALWQPAFVEPYDKVASSTEPTNFYNSLHDYPSKTFCGASGTETCGVNIYEYGNSTNEGSIDQTHLDYITAGAGEGIVAALEPLLNLQYYGLQNQNFFALTESYNAGPNGELAKMWGSVIDMGGSTNNARPQFLAMSLANKSMIGPMFACPISSNATFNFAGSPTNGVSLPPGIEALSNVPYLYSFCFENGTSRSLVLFNTDIASSHSISFSGSNTPTGTVTVRQYAPSGLDLLNEAATGSATNHTAATVATTSTTISNPTSITLPAHSITALDYTATSAADAAEPTFSPASGTYTVAQNVTLSDTSSGAIIYYTTNGTTPTIFSSVYTGPITVGASETLAAIAVAPGYSSSPSSSAAYTINNTLTAPVFSNTGGTFTTAQTVTLTDATSGAAIYYTTNGTTPTSASTKYASAITVSASETIEAIAIGTGYINSPVASATFTIASVLPTPTFTPTAGTYTSTQTVSILDATAGTTIYYTINGTTPTTGSSLYSAAISVSATETIKAIAVKTGSTNSLVASALFTINAPVPVVATPVYSKAGGTFPSAQSITITDSTVGAVIYYTVNGTTPTTGSTKYTGAITVKGENETLKAIAVATGDTTSVVSTALFHILPSLPPPGFSVASGTFSTTQTVAINTTAAKALIASVATAVATVAAYEPAVTVYYTTNGTAPTTSSSVYTTPITIKSTETLEAISVATGFTSSPVASASYTIASGTTYINFATSGISGSHIWLNGSSIKSGVLELTDGGVYESRNAWYMTQLPVSSFVTDFTFTISGVSDGMTFTFQNAGLGEVGSSGGGLGYQGIPKSVAVKFDIHSNAGEGSDSTGVYLNGASPTVPSFNLIPSGVILASGDLMHAHLVYSGTALTMTLTDTVTGAAVTTQFTVNIPAAVGGTTAYMGFTGGAGGSSAIQKVYSWTYLVP